MANDGPKQPLLSPFLDPTPQIYQKGAPKRGRFRRCKSAPLAGFLPPETDCNSSVPLSESSFYTFRPSLRKVAVFLAIYLVLGTVCFSLVSDQIEGKKTNGILDAVYFCIVTMTTVGYGDLVPNSVSAKLLACSFVFSGMALIGLVLSSAADYLVEKQEILLVKALHIRKRVSPTDIMMEIENNRARYKCLMVLILLLVLIVSGIVFLTTVEKLDFVDALYCVCSTITTLGYGDKSFSTKAGRIFAVFWILTGTICLAQFFLYLAELNTERRQRALVKWVLTRKMTNVDLEAADLDDDVSENINADTKVFGLISNPVGHSKGPLLHNPALRYTGYNGIYVPMLVDDIKEFFRVYTCTDFAGFSVGIPHKEAAVRCCDEVDPLAKSIGAVNTIIRRPTDGKLIGYNTDCEACITAIEDALRERRVASRVAKHTSPLAGKVFVLVGAGGAGRALAFGAKSRGARVVIFNRNYERAKALALAVSGEALPYECLDKFWPENGMIFANASAMGMQPNLSQTPISREALGAYELVFDAVYTPRNTRLLREAAEAGAIVVSGVEMFIRQALGQFKLFTGGLAPEDFMRQIIYNNYEYSAVLV